MKTRIHAEVLDQSGTLHGQNIGLEGHIVKVSSLHRQQQAQNKIRAGLHAY